jgi:hypothetical protein
MAKKKSGAKLSEPIARELVAKFRALMPSSTAVSETALNAVLDTYGGDVEAMKRGASQIICDSEALGYKIYLEAEHPASATALTETFGSLLASGATGDEGIRLVADNARALNQFYLSMSQSRKVRAGGAFESYFDTLFRNLGYPFERENLVNGTPDFVFPSAKHFKHFSTDCIVFTCKRTLRERWRQITTEGSRGFVLFLGTMDEDVKANDLDQMNQQKVLLVVPDAIRATCYPTRPNVLSVEQFLIDYLDPGMERWRRNKVIP